MKKLIGSILLCSFAYLGTGQITYNDSREDFLAAMQRNKNFRNQIVKGKIISAQTFVYKNNNLIGSLAEESKYDTRGNCTDFFQYKNGKLKWHTSNTYDDSNRVTQFAFYKGTQNLKRMCKNTYDKSGNLVEQDFYKSDPKTIISKIIRTYDSRNNITESKSFDRKGKLIGRIVYTYYDDGSKKQTIQYAKSGKVERVWNFDCNPVGKLEAKKFKDTAKVCIHYETDKDGNQIKVKEEYLGAGILGFSYRRVTKFDKDNNQIDLAYYKFNGKQIVHWSATYNASGKMTESILYKARTQEVYSRITYSYNSEGTMQESVIYRKSAIPYSTMKYIYTSSLSAPK